MSWLKKLAKAAEKKSYTAATAALLMVRKQFEKQRINDNADRIVDIIHEEFENESNIFFIYNDAFLKYLYQLNQEIEAHNRHVTEDENPQKRRALNPDELFLFSFSLSLWNCAAARRARDIHSLSLKFISDTATALTAEEMRKENSKKLSPEDKQKLASYQKTLIDIMTTVEAEYQLTKQAEVALPHSHIEDDNSDNELELSAILEQQEIALEKQHEFQQSLIIWNQLHDAVVVACRMIANKLIEFEKKPATNSRKAHILKNALGVNPADKNTLSHLMQEIESNIKHQKPIHPQHEIFNKFVTIINQKVVIPLQRYPEEDGFLKKLKTWFSDLFKDVFGIERPRSTGLTLVNIRHHLFNSFTESKERAENISAPEAARRSPGSH